MNSRESTDEGPLRLANTSDIVAFMLYKGSSPRAADAARCTRARKIRLNAKGGGILGGKIGANRGLIVLRTTCAPLISLCGVVWLLEMSRSDRLYGCSLRKYIYEGGREDNQTKKQKKG